MSLELNAADFIKKYEGYTGKAMWDVNAWRIGHGSDTITLPDGTYRAVVSSDTTTPELARKDLARRISKEFIPRVKKKLGAETWDWLPENAQIALLSFAYNYGNIVKKGIVSAAQKRDLKALSDSIVSTTLDDNKRLPENVREVLRKRRREEAAKVLEGSNVSRSTERSGGGFFWIILFVAAGFVVYFIFFT